MNKRQRAVDKLFSACEVAYLEAEMYLQNEDLGAEDAEYMFKNILKCTREALRAAGKKYPMGQKHRKDDDDGDRFELIF